MNQSLGSDQFTASAPSLRRLSLFIVLVGLALFAIELTGFPNLSDNERRVGAYALDLLHNGRWFAPREFAGNPITKPPALTWLVALSNGGRPTLSLFALYWPNALATILTAVTLLHWGRRYFGWQAGFLSALTYLLSPVGYSQMTTCRYDGLLALPVTLAAMAAFRAWTARTSWTWFWLAATFGTLVKGPIVIVLGGAGLLAALWEKLTGHALSIRGKHWWGLTLFLAICGGWFWLAYREAGPRLVQTMLGAELTGALAGGQDANEHVLGGFYEPPLNFLTLYAPWSLLALWAFWQVVRRPSPGDDARRLERFIFCWFVVGLIIFCVAAHQRSRLIIPLLPAAALLAGRELARLLARRPVLKLAGAVAVLALVGAFINAHHLQERSRRVQATLVQREMADAVRHDLGDAFPLVHVNTPFAIQFYLQTGWPYVSPERAVGLLADDYPAYVAVAGYEELFTDLKTNAAIHELIAWPRPGKPELRIFGNRPAAEATNRFATLQGPFRVRLEHAQLVSFAAGEFTFRRTSPTGQIRLLNQSAEPQPVSVRVLAAESQSRPAPTRRTLAPNETWEIPR